MKQMNLTDKIIPNESLSLQHYYAQLQEALAALSTNGALFFKVDGVEEPCVFENIVSSAKVQAVGISLRKVSTRPHLSSKDKEALQLFLENQNESGSGDTDARSLADSLSPLEFRILQSLYSHGGAMAVCGYTHEHHYEHEENVLDAAMSLLSKELISSTKGVGTRTMWMELTGRGRAAMGW